MQGIYYFNLSSKHSKTPNLPNKTQILNHYNCQNHPYPLKNASNKALLENNHI